MIKIRTFSLLIDTYSILLLEPYIASENMTGHESKATQLNKMGKTLINSLGNKAGFKFVTSKYSFR